MVWMKSWLLTLVIEGLLLYPVVMLQAYFSMDVETALLCAAVIVGVMKILAFYKAYNIFFSTRGGIVQNFLYFCTLELIPLGVRRAYLVLVKMKKKGGELVHRTKSYMLSCLSRELKQIVVFLSATRAERPF